MWEKPIKGVFAPLRAKRRKMAGKWRKKLKWLGCDLRGIMVCG